MRYVTMRRPRSATQQDLWESPMLEGKTVLDPEPVDTGLVDQTENAIYRIDPQAGTIDPSVMIPFATDVAGMATTGSLAAPSVAGAVGSGIRTVLPDSGLPMDHASRMARASEQGFDLPLYHKTTADISEFAPNSHFGTIDQANMRGAGTGASVMPVLVKGGKFKRLTDVQANKPDALARARREGYDGVVYLNRYEGVPLDEFQTARAKGLDIDALPDSKFRKVVPSAQDSYIVFDPKNIRSTAAAFDPARKNSANILAANGAPIPVVGGTQDASASPTSYSTGGRF